MPSSSLFLLPLLLLLAASDYSTAKISPHSSLMDRRADSIAVVGTASRFHDALRSGDIAEVKRLIASDLSVLEGGEVETRAQYLSHHLAADIEFAKAVRSERAIVSYASQGAVAWLVSTSTAIGKFDSRDINSVGAELMIMSRAQKTWQIRAVHWSSQRRQAP